MSGPEQVRLMHVLYIISSKQPRRKLYTLLTSAFSLRSVLHLLTPTTVAGVKRLPASTCM